MPLPGTKVIPQAWSRHHQPTATGGMNATVTVTDPARTVPGAWDDATGTYGPPTPHVVADAILARVQAVQSDQASVQAGQESTTRDYLVQLDDPGLSTLPDIEVGYRVTVTTAANDPHLVGLDLTVTDVQHGSERFTRDVVATHSQQPPTT